MKTIIKSRWVIFLIWVVATVLLTAFQPNVSAILHNKGQSALNDSSQSVVASNILKEMETTEGTNDIIVFYNENKLTDSQKTDIEKAVTAIRGDSTDLGITEMIDPFSMPEATSLYSDDGTTLMVSIKVDKNGRTVDQLQEQFNNKLGNVNTEYYLSGEDFIQNDYLKASEAGIQKSAILTVLFILIVLIIVFRSVITPIVSILAVAFAYLTSMGIAAQLIDKANFPLTSLSQILLILILFGIGTDYNILLFSRFREELSNGLAINDAIIKTYKTAGKTITYSVITVLIAFLSLVFAECPIYQSGIIVVIGAAMLLLEILTLTPFVMKTLGKKLFWPSKGTTGHKESKVWGTMSTFSTKHSIVAFIAILIIIVPMLLFNKEKLSFNLVGELGDSYTSSKGFNIVADHYGAGQTMPTTVVIKSDEALDNNESLAEIDTLTQNLKNINGVKKVSSITQPQGDQIDGFYLGTQLSTVAAGMGQSQAGLTQIYQVLQAAQTSMGSQAFDSMIQGLQQISSGLGQTDAYLSSLSDSKTFYMPEQAMTNASYQQAMSMFMSGDKKITKLTIVLNDDPYSEAAQSTVKKIETVLNSTLQSSTISNVQYGVSGTSATTAETNDVLSRDLQKTAIFVIIGVFIVLLLVIRNIWESAAIVGALIGAFYTASTILNVIFLNILGFEGISSFVPFFAFIVIVALGVDYSIFIMMRFKEYPDMLVKDAIVLACRHMGGVVMSAMIILGGTFATLMPSGLVLLEELATAVIVGLLMLCFVLLPIFLPAAIALPNKVKKIATQKK